MFLNGKSIKTLKKFISVGTKLMSSTVMFINNLLEIEILFTIVNICK